jgi:hypothetical protein
LVDRHGAGRHAVAPADLARLLIGRGLAGELADDAQLRATFLRA